MAPEIRFTPFGIPYLVEFANVSIRSASSWGSSNRSSRSSSRTSSPSLTPPPLPPKPRYARAQTHPLPSHQPPSRSQSLSPPQSRSSRSPRTILGLSCSLLRAKSVNMPRETRSHAHASRSEFSSESGLSSPSTTTLAGSEIFTTANSSTAPSASSSTTTLSSWISIDLPARSASPSGWSSAESTAVQSSRSASTSSMTLSTVTNTESEFVSSITNQSMTDDDGRHDLDEVLPKEHGRGLFIQFASNSYIPSNASLISKASSGSGLYDSPHTFSHSASISTPSLSSISSTPSSNSIRHLQRILAAAVVEAGMDTPDTPSIPKSTPGPEKALYRGTYGQVMAALKMAGLTSTPCAELGPAGRTSTKLGTMFVVGYGNGGEVELTKLTLWG